MSAAAPLRLGAAASLLSIGTDATANAQGPAPAFLAVGRSRAPPLGATVGPASRAPAVGGFSVAAAPTALPDSLAAATALLACVALGTRRRARGRGSAAARAAVVVEIDEAATTERELAQLRAEVSKLEEEQASQRLEEKRGLFKAFDTDMSGGLDVVKLQRGLRDLHATEVDAETALRLLRDQDKNGDEALEFEEFDLPRMQNTLAKWRMEELVARREERERAEQAEREFEENPLARWPASVEPPVRLGSMLAYLLPLMDCLQYIPLVMVTPALQLLLLPVILSAQLVSAVPLGLGPLALFLSMQFGSGNQELPLPLRFNLRQAVVLDVAAGLIRLLAGVVAFLAQGQIPSSVSDAGNGALFLVVAGCAAYSMARSLLGAAPDDIPGVSDYTKGSMRRESKNGDDNSPA